MKARESIFASELLDLANAERKARKDLLVEPDFYRGELSDLVKLHVQIARAIESYINDWGWPGAISVGWEGNFAAAYLVSHAITQPKFMRFCLPFLEQAYRFGDANGICFATLYDAIMYFEGKPQVYGTYLDWDRQGRLAAWRVVDPAKLNSRRWTMLVEPAQKYIRTMQAKADAENWPVPSDIEAYRMGIIDFSRRFGWLRVSV